MKRQDFIANLKSLEETASNISELARFKAVTTTFLGSVHKDEQLRDYEKADLAELVDETTRQLSLLWERLKELQTICSKTADKKSSEAKAFMFGQTPGKSADLSKQK